MTSTASWPGAGIRRIRGILIIGFAFWAGSSPTAGADDEPYVAEYQASQAALRSGDPEAAAAHALRAWKSAEKLLGDDRLTAILAYNYGHLVLSSDPESADRAMARAVELQNAGIAALDEGDLHLYATYAAFKAHGFERKRADQLRDMLESREADGSGVAHTEQAVIWLDLAAGYLADRQFDDAAASAERVETLLRRAAPEDRPFLAQAGLIGAIARLARKHPTVEAIQSAHNALVRARQLFPPQEDIEHFDPVLAEVLAWSALADAALARTGRTDYPDHENGSPHLLPDFLLSGGNGWQCNIPELPEWDRSGGLRGTIRSLYTRKKRDEYIGGLVVGLHVDEDLTITDVRVLAEVPASMFTGHVRQALEGIRLPADSAKDRQCTGELIKAFRLRIDFELNVRHM